MIWIIFGHFFEQVKHYSRSPQSLPVHAECDSNLVADQIHKGRKIPTKTLYHYGKKDILLKNVAANHIPLDDWNRFIMGNETRYKLKRFRRGLYGTEKIEDADRFGSEKYNWAMAIELKPECLKPERVVSLVGLNHSPDFKKWFERADRRISFSDFSKRCFDGKVPSNRCFVTYETDLVDNQAESIIALYYQEKNFAFVHDFAGDLVRSWAVIDRNCIESIKGSSEYWLNEFGKDEELWKNTCNLERNHRNLTRILFSSLIELGNTENQLEKIATLTDGVAAPPAYWDFGTRDTDQFAIQDFVHELVEARTRCKDEPFRSVLSRVLKQIEEMQSPEVKELLEKACR